MIKDSYDELVGSAMVKGSPAYGVQSKIKPWYSYLYIAKFEEKNKYKIGITSSIYRRDSELFRKNVTQNSSEIVYTWSLPFGAEVEAKVKSLLSKFTRKDSKETGRTEIFFGLKLFPFILLVRCMIVYICLKGNYIPFDKRAADLQDFMVGFFDSAKPDKLKYFDEIYLAQTINTFSYRINKLLYVVRRANEYYNRYNGRSFLNRAKEVISKDIVLPFISEIYEMDFPLDFPNSIKDPPKNVKEAYDWLGKFLEWVSEKDFDEPNSIAQIRPEFVNKSQEELDREAGRIIEDGAHVTVSYPREEKYAGVWHGKIVKYIAETPGGEEGYIIKWFEKNPDSNTDWTNTTVPKPWVKRDRSIERVLDIITIVRECAIPEDPIEQIQDDTVYVAQPVDDETPETLSSLKL